MKTTIYFLLLTPLLLSSTPNVKELFELEEPDTAAQPHHKKMVKRSLSCPAPRVCAKKKSSEPRKNINVATIEQVPLPSPAVKSAESAQPSITTSKTEPNTKAETPKERTLTVINRINHDMKTYKKHWSGHHTPTTFIVRINGEPLSEIKEVITKKKKPVIQSTPEPQSIQLASNEAEIEIEYEFTAMGVSYRKGVKKVKAIISEAISEIETTFSWEEDSRIIVHSSQKPDGIQLIELS